MTEEAQIENCWPLHWRLLLFYFCPLWLIPRAFILLYSRDHTGMVSPRVRMGSGGLGWVWVSGAALVPRAERWHHPPGCQHHRCSRLQQDCLVLRSTKTQVNTTTPLLSCTGVQGLRRAGGVSRAVEGAAPRTCELS